MQGLPLKRQPFFMPTTKQNHLTIDSGQTHPVVLFDGVCNFCNRMVNLAIRNDPKGRLRFAALQSAAGQALLQQYQVTPTADTLVLIEGGKAYTYARAAIRICRYLRWPMKMFYAFRIFPVWISQPFYKWFARHRYQWFGKKETCMIPDQNLRSRFLD